MNPNQDMLFVCGTPRSGTTAMHALLTEDPRIVMGMERYGGYLNDEFGPQLFTKDRFFDFETDPRDKKSHHPYYGELARTRYDTAIYVGDKIPLIYLCFDQVTRVFPQAKFVVLLRNILDICNSYQNRKENPRDDWALTVTDAVQHWNQLLAFLKKNSADPRIKCILYEEFFADIKCYEDLQLHLGLSFGEAHRRKYQEISSTTERLESHRKSSLTDQQKLEIFRTANLALYQSLLDANSPKPALGMPEAKPDAQSPASMPLDESDVLSAYRIVIGTSEPSFADTQALAGLNGQQALARMFASPDFQANPFNRELITSLAKQIRESLAKSARRAQ